MPKDRPGSARVDAWDAGDEDEIAPRAAAARRLPAAVPGAAAGPAAALPLAPADSAADSAADATAPPPLTWRQMFRGTPIWVWGISCLTIGSICAMFFTIMLLIAGGK